MRIRVVGRKQGDTAKEVGAAIAAAVGAINAGKHKGIIKGKCLWMYNQYTEIATIKLMLVSTRLVVKLDIYEYKYTDIEAVLAAATKLYKEDEASQFMSSAMYKNIKAISDARFLGYMDTNAIATIFIATCEAAAAEATIPQSADFNVDYGTGTGTAGSDSDSMIDPLYGGMARTAIDMLGLQISLTRFAWYTNWVIGNTDTTVIQDVYTSMVSSLTDAADNDWTDSYKEAINRAIDAIRKVKDSVPAYLAALQTQYTEIPTTNIGADARELREAILAVLPIMSIGVGIEVMYRMFGVITVATVVEVCAPYINRGIETFNRIANDQASPWSYMAEQGPIVFTLAFGQGCPTAAVETVTDVSTVYVDGAVAARVYAMPTAKYIMRYVTRIQGSLEYTSTQDSSSSSTITVSGSGGSTSTTNSLSSGYSGQASIDANSTIPCALLMNVTGADISEEMQFNGSIHTVEQVTRGYDYKSSSQSDPIGSEYGSSSGTSASHGGYTYARNVDCSGTCSTKLLIPCKGIYANGAGFPVSTNIQLSTNETSGGSAKYNMSDEGTYNWNPRGGDTTHTYSSDSGGTSTGSMEAAITPTYTAYPLLVGTVIIIGAVPVSSTGSFTHADTATYNSTNTYGAPSTTNTRIHNVATFNTNIMVGAAQVGSSTLASTMEFATVYPDGVTPKVTHTRNDTVSSTANMSLGAEYYPDDGYKELSETLSAYALAHPTQDYNRGTSLVDYGGAMPRYIDLEYIKNNTQVYNTSYGVRYARDIDAQSMHHIGSYDTTMKYKGDETARVSSDSHRNPYQEGGDTTNKAQDANTSAAFKTTLSTAPIFTDGEYGPETAADAGKVTIIDGTGGKVYTADIIGVISEAVYSGYAMRAVDYVQLFVPDPNPINGNTHDPIVNPPGIPLLVGWGDYLTYNYIPLATGDGFAIVAPNVTDPCGVYTKTVTPSTPVYTVDTAPRNILDYNKLLRSPEFLVLNALMREEYLDTSVEPPSPKHVPTFVPLSEAVQYMSIQGEGTPAPALDVGYIQPWYIKDTSRITQVKERVNSNIATKLQELENKYLRDNPEAPVDEEMHKRFTPAAIEAVIEEQLFTPIRGILPAHTEVKTTAVRPVGAGTDSTAEPMDIEYVLSVVSRGIGTYVDLGVLV
jgi:hypothetical protein